MFVGKLIDDLIFIKVCCYLYEMMVVFDCFVDVGGIMFEWMLLYGGENCVSFFGCDDSDEFVFIGDVEWI